MSEATELFSIHPDVKVTAEGHVTTVTIDRPDTKNACTGDMWVAIGETFRRLAYSGTRVIVLTGGGTDFCAGADLSGSGAAGAGAAAADRWATSSRACVSSATRSWPCTAARSPRWRAVDGVAVGAGFGLSLACDLTVCSDRARFSAIFAKRGISLDFGTSWLLRQRIGVHRAKELAVTARMVHGPEAYELGLVNRVVPVDDLDAATAEFAEAIAGGPPLALSMTKRELDKRIVVVGAGARDRGARPERERRHRGHPRGTHRLRRRRPPEFHGR